MNRRSLFKYLGAAIVAAPFVAFENIEEVKAAVEAPKPYLISTIPLNEGVIPDHYTLSTNVPSPIEGAYLGYDVLKPKVMYNPLNQPTRSDPLGQRGCVAWKLSLPDGRQYGDWIEFTDYDGEWDDAAILSETLPLLREQMELTMAFVAPNITIQKTWVSIPSIPSKEAPNTYDMHLFTF